MFIFTFLFFILYSIINLIIGILNGVNTMRLTTKDKILELIKKESAMTVNDLTNRLNITHMAVRKHLATLEKENYIYAVEVKQPMGRPTLVYSLTDKGEHSFPKNYETITLEFLQDLEEIHGEEVIYDLFKRREARLTKEYEEKLRGKDPKSKVKEIVHIQNEKGYMSELKQIDENVYELTEYNCPILAVATKYNVACECETELFKNILDTDGVKRIDCKTEGGNHCTFRFELNEKK